MADENDKVHDEATAWTDHAIDRDPGFVRLSADNVVVIDRYADIELALIAHGPEPDVQQVIRGENGGLSETGDTRLRTSFTELGRVRIYPPTAINMAMNIIEKSLQQNRINIPGFRAAIDALIIAYDDKSDAEPAADQPAPSAEAEV
ncbi:hypothetical protein D9601_19325 [Sphingomonas sp. MA1305]|uniref:hypothetical protein n=1 Tax=Sphingomonas sp. MA1305 TaxID=2479204 RepID=UPI0018DFD415|nr:hypothetical protein [Sphingomonas sp. MA1305]MBI0477490.1 hypothetical protein [Sphingomonas sp. MA1305]